MIKAGEYERYKYYELAFVVPDNGGNTGKRGQAKDREESIRRAMHRAKEKIYGYVIANDWEYWATQTFNMGAIDRYNLDEIVKRYNMKLKNIKRRQCPELKWLIVPEQHKDGAWHLHMFMSGIPKERMKYSGCDHYSGDKKRPIYNWLDTDDYGFNYYLYIVDLEPLERVIMTNYITKYITKDLVEKRFNKKMYWCSRGLWEPSVASTYVYDYDVETIKSSGTIITQNTYYIKDPESGDIFNKVHDFTLYNPCPF